MSKPLTRKEKIYAIALGLGFMMENRKDGDQQNIFRGLKMLRYLIEDEDHKELRELAERGAIMDEIDFSKLASEPDPQANQVDEILHEMPRMERYACIAIGMAKMLKAGGEQFIKPHKRLLKAMLKEDDLRWCQETVREGLKKCGCETCMRRLKLVDKTEAMNGTLSGVSMEEFESIVRELVEEEEQPDKDKEPETTTEDPWKAFGA